MRDKDDPRKNGNPDDCYRPRRPQSHAQAERAGNLRRQRQENRGDGEFDKRLEDGFRLIGGAND